MPFTTSIAGPSRVRAVAVTRRLARANSTTAAPEADDDARAAQARAQLLWQTDEGYQQWKRLKAQEFRSTPKGERAQWLGGSIPYATNPSFRPPPPISNELQDVIYREMRKGRFTTLQLSERYQVSKARIEAIRKLKQVEDEFKRQKLPLQEAFLAGMEPLLGVPKAPAKESQLVDVEMQSSARQASTRVEREEETRFLDGLGAGGAFGDRTDEDKRVERTAWEFREEGEAPEETIERQVVKAVKNVKEGELVQPGKSMFRFVDTSR